MTQRKRTERETVLMVAWPKGCKIPQGYLAWQDCAEAQTLHGVKQVQCKGCKLYLFPQEVAAHKCRQAARSKGRRISD